MSALYIHIPFCLQKCSYCSFFSVQGSESLQRHYCQALLKELEQLKSHEQAAPLETLFIGGGTPTALSADSLCEIIIWCRDNLGFWESAEISVEVNPGTVDSRYLKKLLHSGVNRLSLGVQSFNDLELRELGRIHGSRDAVRTVMAAKETGFANISLDLMFGLQGQSLESWTNSLQTAFELPINHLSIYQLTVEEKTPLERVIQSGDAVLPGEEEIELMDDVIRDMSLSAEFIQYEISNFALPGFECRHNLTYWRNQPYLAVGAGAVSYVDGARERRIENVRKYIENISTGKSVIVERETLDRETAFRESVVIGLRMREGVSLRELESRYNMEIRSYYGETLDRLVAAGLVSFTKTHCYITEKGWLLANRIMTELV